MLMMLCHSSTISSSSLSLTTRSMSSPSKSGDSDASVNDGGSVDSECESFIELSAFALLLSLGMSPPVVSMLLEVSLRSESCCVGSTAFSTLSSSVCKNC